LGLGINDIYVDESREIISLDSLNLEFIQIKGGFKTSLLITKSGNCFYWGGNKTLPVKIEQGIISTKKIKNCSVGRNHCIVIDYDGNCFGWGKNYDNQLGTSCGDFVVESAIQIEGNWNIEGGLDFVESFDSYCLALSKNCQIYGWGYSFYHRFLNSTKVPLQLDF